MNAEIWKDVVGYEGLYKVSNLGRVKSLPRNGTIKTEKLLKDSDNGTGYRKITLKNVKSYTTYVHILVAQSFLNYKKNKGVVCVDHINNVRSDNRLENLQIITPKENICRAKQSNTGSTGVYKVRNKFRVILNSKHIGYYNNLEQAKQIYLTQSK
jgi:hypothetical protein